MTQIIPASRRVPSRSPVIYIDIEWNITSEQKEELKNVGVSRGDIPTDNENLQDDVTRLLDYCVQ